MIEQLEKILSKRSTVKNFNGNPLESNHISTITEAVAKTPSCNNRYNFKVKVLGQKLDDRKAKLNLYDYVCTVSKENVRYSEDEDLMVIRSPKSYKEARDWHSKNILSSGINGQMLAPLVLVWYFTDRDAIENDYLDIGLSCWNTVITSELLGIQSGFCSCFDADYLQNFLGIEGKPVVMAGFGYAQSTISNDEKHSNNPRPSSSDILV
jgi:nitroreductase